MINNQFFFVNEMLKGVIDLHQFIIKYLCREEKLKTLFLKSLDSRIKLSSKVII